VFSPYYASARRRAPGAADPHDHCAMNVALYGQGGHHWAMTERGRSALSRDSAHLQIGPSMMAWEGDTLVVTLDEVTVPWPSRLRGTVRLRPAAFTGQSFALDAQAHHHWHPLAPSAQVDVQLAGLEWQGTGYLDSNDGSVPLEQDFNSWQWSRADLGADRSVVLYDTVPRAGEPRALALRFDANGAVEHLQPQPVSPLPRTGWRVARCTRSEGTARVLQTLEDAPFYARSLVQATLCGQAVTAVHESLSLERFVQPVVQCMLPFRMPRRGRWEAAT
jgi:carotenoid 1,2-hydratase